MSSLPGTNGRRRIYLLRHGAVEYFNADGTTKSDAHEVGLTGAGRRQASLMGELLGGIRFDRVIHSGMPRSRETAELVVGPDVAAGLEEVHDFREIELGRIDQLPPHRVDAEFTYGFEAAGAPGAALARGERFGDFFERVTGGFTALLGNPGWARLLLVAHGGTNRAILSWTTGGGLHSLASFEQDECCLNVIDVDLVDGEVVRRYLRAMNLTPYNLAKEGLFMTTLERAVADRVQRGCE